MAEGRNLNRFKALLAGGLPQALDLGRPAGGGDKKTERAPPQDAQTKSVIPLASNNMMVWIGLGIAGLVAVAVLVRK